MALIVQKFGGTSVGDLGRIRNVARRVARSATADGAGCRDHEVDEVGIDGGRRAAVRAVRGVALQLDGQQHA